jgi:hypothetical protein
MRSTINMVVSMSTALFVAALLSSVPSERWQCLCLHTFMCSAHPYPTLSLTIMTRRVASTGVVNGMVTICSGGSQLRARCATIVSASAKLIASLLTNPSDHRTRLKRIHEDNEVSISKVTHGARSYAATAARSHGATETGTKAMGGWSESGSFRACYDRALPVDALLGSAGFNGRKPETYFVARDRLGKSSRFPQRLIFC